MPILRRRTIRLTAMHVAAICIAATIAAHALENSRRIGVQATASAEVVRRLERIESEIVDVRQLIESLHDVDGSESTNRPEWANL